jgi:hypothetical protein
MQEAYAAMLVGHCLCRSRDWRLDRESTLTAACLYGCPSHSHPIDDHVCDMWLRGCAYSGSHCAGIPVPIDLSRRQLDHVLQYHTHSRLSQSIKKKHHAWQSVLPGAMNACASSLSLLLWKHSKDAPMLLPKDFFTSWFGVFLALERKEKPSWPLN